MNAKLRLNGNQHSELRRHLYPGDGLEAAAVALCGRRSGQNGQILVVQRIVPIPYDECERRADYLRWKTARIEPLLIEAERRHLALVKFHSHPTGYEQFSRADDAADAELFSSVHGWVDDNLPHASAVMLPDSRLFGRSIDVQNRFSPLECIAVAGDDIQFWFRDSNVRSCRDIDVRNIQAFGDGTFNLLRKLTVGVVGCSGTGSPMVDCLARLGVGRIILFDPQRVEYKNLNRILNAHAEHAALGEFKVHVLARAISRMGFGTEVICVPKNLASRDAAALAAECDVLFGGTDGAEGRYLLNRIATFYSIPLFDCGVRLDADGRGGIDQMTGTVNYIKPGGSSLLSRGVISMAEVDAESLQRTNPAEYEQRLREGYIHGVPVNRPAVAPVNMFYASLTLLEFLARVHRYRADDNTQFASHGMSLVNADYVHGEDGEPCSKLLPYVGRGDTTPFLEMSSLS